jgi:hypothetical protein
VHEIEDNALRPRMPVFLVVWDILECRHTDSELLLCLPGDGTVRLGDDELRIEDFYAARLLELLTFVSEFCDTLRSLLAKILTGLSHL